MSTFGEYVTQAQRGFTQKPVEAKDAVVSKPSVLVETLEWVRDTVVAQEKQIKALEAEVRYLSVERATLQKQLNVALNLAIASPIYYVPSRKPTKVVVNYDDGTTEVLRQVGEHKRKKGPPEGGGPRDESKDRVTIWLPMVRAHRDMLREIHREMVKRDPRTIGDDRVFAALTFGSMIETLHAQVFPKLVQEAGGILPPNAPLPEGTLPLGTYKGQRTPALIRRQAVAKGLTTAPLTIVVADEWYSHPKVLELMAAGHNVWKWGAGVMISVDLILHPAAHGWNDMMFDYLPAAIAAARRRRKRETAA